MRSPRPRSSIRAGLRAAFRPTFLECSGASRASSTAIPIRRNGASTPRGAHQLRQPPKDRRVLFQSGLGPAHPRDEITSVLVLSGASTALARNGLREAGPPVFLALRYMA